MRNTVIAVLAFAIVACSSPIEPPKQDTLPTPVPPAPVPTSVAVPVPAGLEVGALVRLSAVVRDAQGNVMPNVTATGWQSSDPTKATVSSTGEMRVYAPGPVDITASVGQLVATAPVQAALQSSIREILQAVSWSGGADTVTIGTRVRATIGIRDTTGADVSLTGKYLTWGTHQPRVAIVDDSGWVTALGGSNVGTGVNGACITVTLNGLSRCKMLYVRGPLPLEQKPMVAIVGPTDTLTVGQQGVVLSASLRDTLGVAIPQVPVVWGSANENVVKIEVGTGRLTLVAPGSATVTATMAGAVRQFTVRVK